jgi:hypothetical protein
MRFYGEERGKGKGISLFSKRRGDGHLRVFDLAYEYGLSFTESWMCIVLLFTGTVEGRV